MKRKKAWRRVLRDMRLNIVAAVLLMILSAASVLLLRDALLRNAWETGMTLASNYAAEERTNLSVYEALIAFGTASIDKQLENSSSLQDLTEWLDIYFDRLEATLGDGIVDPYAVVNGKILAANPWEGDEEYDVYATEWYQMADAADGDVIFTGVYTDAVYGKPVITVAQACESCDAVLAFDIFPENLRFQFKPLELPEGCSFFLCDRAGTIIYSQTDLTRPDPEIQDYCTGLIEKIRAGSLGEYDSSALDLEGQRRAVYYTRVGDAWYSIVTVPYDNILGDLDRFTLLFSTVTAVFLLALAATAWRDMRYASQMERTNETVRVLGNSYYALYRVDLQAGAYEMIKGSDYVRQRLPYRGQYEELIRVISEVIEPDAYEDFKNSFSRESIQGLVARRVRNFGGDFLRLFNGEYRWVSVRVLFDESLAPGEVVLCFQEVQQEKQAQLRERRLLEDALAAALKNEEAKQAFFSNMSHDMRTPLNAIIGLSALARQSVRDPEKTDAYLDKIQYSSRQLLSLINDILDMSRMEQGKIMVSNERLDLQSCVEACVQSFQFQAEAEGKTLTSHIALEDRTVLGDSFRISQILNNLLSNAFKFSDRGASVSVSLTQLDRQDFAKYKLVVADTGRGMSEEFLPHLFEPYSRELRFSAKKTMGTGLGMPIIKNLISQMNGEIRVESAPGKGTVFTIILPFAVIRDEAPADSPAPAEPAAPVQLAGARILLAEDNAVNMEIATELLSMNGVEVTQAWNGQEALERFQASAPFTFDAILMDMQMPEMDGCESARLIRALDRPDAKTVPIIAVTANAFSEDISATAAAGMDAHVAKPIDFALLSRTLEQFIRRRGKPGPEQGE